MNIKKIIWKMTTFVMMAVAIASSIGTLNVDAADNNLEATTVQVDVEERQQMNIFLSNFAEQFITEDFDINSSDVNWICDFAYKYTYNNTSYVFEEKEFPSKEYFYYYKFPLDKLNEVSDRFFGKVYTKSELSAYKDEEQYSFQEDGNIYYASADGDSYTGIAIVDEITLASDDRFLVSFTIYEFDIEKYWENDGVVPKEYYLLDSQQANNKSELELVITGYAEISSYLYNGNNTFRLEKYIINDTEKSDEAEVLSSLIDTSNSIVEEVCGTYYYYSTSYTDEYDEITHTSPEHIEPDTNRWIEIKSEGSEYYITTNSLQGEKTEKISLIGESNYNDKKIYGFEYEWSSSDYSYSDVYINMDGEHLYIIGAHSSEVYVRL